MMECMHRGQIHTQGKQGKAYRCKLFGTCSVEDTGLKSGGNPLPVCGTCPERITQVEISKQSASNASNHLIYHIWPKRGNGTWQWNVAELLKRIDLFDGVRSIAVVLDGNTDTIEAVKRAFGTTRIDNWIVQPNRPKLGEVMSFGKLLDTLPKTGRTFYAHAKGVKYDTFHLKDWTDQMYRLNLDLPHRPWNALRSHLSAGAFVQDISSFTPLKHRWCYAGTFFWFNNSILDHPEIRTGITQGYWGVEGWLGNIFPRETSFNLCPIPHASIHWKSESDKTGAWVNQLFSNTVPIYINARNLLTPLVPMVEYLLKLPHAMPIIVDNDSTYQPLLDYYKTCPVRVIKTGVNGGKFGWAKHLLDHKSLGFSKYVVTDPDLELEAVPTDVLDVCSKLLDENPDVTKVGLSLDLESIADEYPFRDLVNRIESKYWQTRRGNTFEAPIDTTFAMRRASDPIDLSNTRGHLRTDRPYTAIHWPWKWTPKLVSQSEEMRNYLGSSNEVSGGLWQSLLNR